MDNSVIEREFYVGVHKTVTLIFEGRKILKKYNAAKSYSIYNDWHINELASEISIINREKISSAAELENRIEKIATDINELQSAVNELVDMQRRIREVITNAEFYFQNQYCSGDAMFVSKLASAKELLDKFSITSLSELEPLQKQYSENVKVMSEYNAKIGELHGRRSSLLRLQETYQSITNGNYFERLTENRKESISQNQKIHDFRK